MFTCRDFSRGNTLPQTLHLMPLGELEPWWIRWLIRSALGRPRLQLSPRRLESWPGVRSRLPGVVKDTNRELGDEASVPPPPSRAEPGQSGVRTGVHELMLNRLGLENRLSGDDVKKSRWSRIGVDEISSELNILSGTKKNFGHRVVFKKCSDRLLFKFERSQMQLKL